MRKLNGITINGEYLGNSVVINGMFRAICTISPVMMRDFIYIINKIDALDEAVKIHNFNCGFDNIDIEFDNSDIKGVASLYFKLNDGIPVLTYYNLTINGEKYVNKSAVDSSMEKAGGNVSNEDTTLIDDETSKRKQLLNKIKAKKSEILKKSVVNDVNQNPEDIQSSANDFLNKTTVSFQNDAELDSSYDNSVTPNNTISENYDENSDNIDYKNDNIELEHSQLNSLSDNQENQSVAGSKNTISGNIDKISGNIDAISEKEDTMSYNNTGMYSPEKFIDNQNIEQPKRNQPSEYDINNNFAQNSNFTQNSNSTQNMQANHQTNNQYLNNSQMPYNQQYYPNDATSSGAYNGLNSQGYNVPPANNMQNNQINTESINNNDINLDGPVNNSVASTNSPNIDITKLSDDYINNLSDEELLALDAQLNNNNNTNNESFDIPMDNNINQNSDYSPDFGDFSAMNQPQNTNFGAFDSESSFGNSSFRGLEPDFTEKLTQGLSEGITQGLSQGLQDIFKELAKHLGNGGGSASGGAGGYPGGGGFPGFGGFPNGQGYDVGMQGENGSPDGDMSMSGGMPGGMPGGGMMPQGMNYGQPNGQQFMPQYGYGYGYGGQPGGMNYGGAVNPAMNLEFEAIKAELERLKLEAANNTLPTLDQFKAKQKELTAAQEKMKKQKLRIIGSRGHVNASALDGGVFVAGSKVYKWGDARQLDE